MVDALDGNFNPHPIDYEDIIEAFGTNYFTSAQLGAKIILDLHVANENITSYVITSTDCQID